MCASLRARECGDASVASYNPAGQGRAVALTKEGAFDRFKRSSSAQRLH